MRSNTTDGIQIANFIKGLNRQHKIMLLVGGLSLPFDHEIITLIKRFISSAVGKTYQLRTKKLRELEAPWQPVNQFLLNLLFYIFHCIFITCF